MDAVVLTLSNHTSELTRISKPIPSKGEVLVRVLAAGVCGTDIHIMGGHLDAYIRSDTAVLGHELCGRVEELGSGLEDNCYLSPGQLVVVQPLGQCNHCAQCRSGRYNHCDIALTGHLGYSNSGAWSQWCCVPAERLSIVPRGVPAHIAVLAEPVSCILLGFQRIKMSNCQASSEILILGAGIIGVLAVSILHFRGCRQIAVSDVSEERRNVINDLALPGVTAINPTALSQSTVYQNRFNLVVECCGVPKAMEENIPNLSYGGTLLCFGLGAETDTLALPAKVILDKELEIIGSLANNYTLPEACCLVSLMYKSGYLNSEKYRFRCYPLEQYLIALEDLKKSKICKAFLLPILY